MSETNQAGEAAETAHDWPLRPWLLAGLTGLAGLGIYLTGFDDGTVGWRTATAAFLLFSSVSAALSVDRDHWRAPAVFAVLLGLVMAGLAWRATQYGEFLPDEEYGLAAGLVASLLALPLFQAGFLRERFATPYARAHYHVWNDALCGAGAIAFTGISWLVLLVLSELFHLLKIDLVRDLMEEEAFGWTFSGAAFGAALGTLKNQARVLGTLQSVAMLVLSLLAVPLALGLALFLLATVLSGPQVLWDATRSATPVLLLCAAGAFFLANAVLRNGDAEMTGNRVLRWAALVLAAVVLPLALFAAVSMGLRLHQYGLAPERLWGLVAIVVACAFGLAYWVALVRGRKGGWAAELRQANLHLAVGVCGLAILLALPVLDFGAISTRNQLERLESGRVSVDEFDFSALRWDFGQAGRAALARLAKRPGDLGELARAAQVETQRRYAWDGGPLRERDFSDKLRLAAEDPALRKRITGYLLGNPWQCDSACYAIDLGPRPGGERLVALVQGNGYATIVLPPEGMEGRVEVAAAAPAGPAYTATSRVEVRDVTRRQIFVDGKPLGPVLDEPLEAGNPPR